MHYYAELTGFDGRRQLRELAERAVLAEAFAHVQVDDQSYWFEIGENETPHDVHLVGGFRRLVHDLKTAYHRNDISVTLYQVRPQASRESLSMSMEISLGKGSRASIIPVQQPLTVLEAPDVRDVLFHVLLWETFSKMRRDYPELRVTLTGDRFVTADGVYSLDVGSFFGASLADMMMKDQYSQARIAVEAHMRDAMRQASLSALAATILLKKTPPVVAAPQDVFLEYAKRDIVVRYQPWY